MDVLFLLWFFRLNPRLKLSFSHNTVRKNLSPSADFCRESGLSLREIYRKFELGETLGYEKSYFQFLFRHFKVFRLHAISYGAAGAVQADSGKSLGYCYMAERGKIHVCLVRWLDYSLSFTQNYFRLPFEAVCFAFH